ncbi:polysaccharide biosynthesis/export family protein, partial [bacterium]|nr:polysaccharide biosynthesis/export family protein [bacterium]
MKERVYIQDVKDSETINYTLQSQEYKISSQDILYVTVGTLDKMSLANPNTPMSNGGELLFYLNGYSVNINGELILPEVGSIYVLGKTINQIEKAIQLKVDLLYKDAIVNVKTAGIKINVLGEVNSPGKYTFYQNQVTIFDALSYSGDLTDFAN